MKHKLADISPYASLAPDVMVWQFASILSGTAIYDGSVIGSCCWVGQDCCIGRNVHINHGTFIPHGTLIEDNVFIGPNVTFTDDRHPKSGADYFPEPPIIRHDASIGAGVTVLPGVEIGAGAMIGAGSVVTKNVLPNEIIVGPYARPIEGKAA